RPSFLTMTLPSPQSSAVTVRPLVGRNARRTAALPTWQEFATTNETVHDRGSQRDAACSQEKAGAIASSLCGDQRDAGTCPGSGCRFRVWRRHGRRLGLCPVALRGRKDNDGDQRRRRSAKGLFSWTHRFSKSSLGPRCSLVLAAWRRG